MACGVEHGGGRLDRPVDARVTDGCVTVHCPDGHDVTMTPEAALATSETLLVASLKAMGAMPARAAGEG